MDQSSSDADLKIQALQEMAEAFNRTFTQGAIFRMLKVLSDLKGEHVDEAVNALLRVAERMPTLSMIRDRVQQKHPFKPVAREIWTQEQTIAWIEQQETK